MLKQVQHDGMAGPLKQLVAQAVCGNDIPMTRSALAIILVVILSGCERTPWQGWVYPDPDNERASISLAGFRTFEQCQEAAIAELRRLAGPDKGSYMCGRSCRWDDASRTNICEETRR